MSGWLRLTVVQGRGLAPADASGKSDPYVCASLDGASAPIIDKYGKQAITKAKLQTLTPVWNENFIAKVYRPKGLLRLDVFDHDNVGSDTFIGRAEIEVGCGTPSGSDGEVWVKLMPRPGNKKDQKLWDARAAKVGAGESPFGEIQIRWFWTYSSLGELLSSTDSDLVESQREKPPEYELWRLQTAITRFSNWCYYLCVPWWWLSERFMWTRPYESFFLLALLTWVCVNDMLCELFVLTLLFVLVKWHFHRARWGPDGPPTDVIEGKSYPDPFAWMRAWDNLNEQLHFTQIMCGYYSDLLDYVVEVLTWQRQDTSLALTRFFAVWTALATLGYWPEFRWVFLAAMWYMFIWYPMMFNFPKAYKVLSPGAIVSTLSSLPSLITGKSDITDDSAQDHEHDDDEGAGGAKSEEAGSPTVPAPPGPLKVIKLATSKGWEVVDKQPDVLYERKKVDWCPIAAVRISGLMNTTVEKFAEFIRDPENSKKYDTLLEEIITVEDLPDSKVLHTKFKSPVMFVAPRDMLTRVWSTLLTATEAKQFALCRDVEHTDFPADKARDDTSGIGNKFCFVTGGYSVENKKTPEAKPFVRGKVHAFGWICEPAGDGKCKVQLVLSMEPRGMVPAKAVEITNSEQVVKFRKVRKLVE